MNPYFAIVYLISTVTAVIRGSHCIYCENKHKETKRMKKEFSERLYTESNTIWTCNK